MLDCYLTVNLPFSCSPMSFAVRLVAFACVEGIFFSGRYNFLAVGILGIENLSYIDAALRSKFLCISQFLCHLLA